MRILLLLCLPLFALGQSTLQTAIDNFVAHSEFENASIGIALVDPAGNRYLAGHDPDRTLIPASTLKTITTATALLVFGPEHRFETQLQYTGEIVDGTLRGDLILYGMGDPVLGSDQLEDAETTDLMLQHWLEAIRGAGIRRIEGRVIGDDSYFTGSPVCYNWQWYDLGNYFAAGAHGLNFHENLYYLDLQRTTTVGSAVSALRTRPYIPVQFRSELTTAGPRTGDNAYIYGTPYTYQRTLRGTIPAGTKPFTIKGSIPDPPLFAAQTLHDHLRAQGIEITDSATTTRFTQLPTEGRTIVHRHQSPPLRDVVRRANRKSVNYYCEVLLRHIGKALRDEGSRSGGVAAVQQFWADRGVGLEGWFLMDGSGLSPRNGITARQLSLILAKISKESIYADFLESLSLAGEYGTLRRRFVKSPARGKLWGKSGTLSRVRSFAGYVQRPDGSRVAYTVIVNNYNGGGGATRLKIEALLTEFVR